MSLFFLSWGVLLTVAIQNQDEKFSDVVVSMKAAAIELTRGTNPYSADFHGTILEKTAQYNAPGWIKKGQETYLLFSHYPYTPAAFLVTVPFFIFFSFHFILLDFRYFIPSHLGSPCPHSQGSASQGNGPCSYFFEPFYLVIGYPRSCRGYTISSFHATLHLFFAA
ncbi:MAG: hypothetical protein AABX02_04135 [archaeon]